MAIVPPGFVSNQNLNSLDTISVIFSFSFQILTSVQQAAISVISVRAVTIPLAPTIALVILDTLEMERLALVCKCLVWVTSNLKEKNQPKTDI